METGRHISWENFRLNFIETAVPGEHVIPGIPEIRFIVSADASRIGVRIFQEELPENCDLMLEEVDTDTGRSGDHLYLEISTANRALYEPFFAVMVNIADFIQEGGLSAVTAAQRAVEQFRNLLARRTLMTEDQVIGLWGELWVLRRLLSHSGTAVLDAWRGPRNEVHDFRLSAIELEVKTTRNEERVHVISRLSQLEPSPEMRLFVLSIQLTVTGSSGGLSLPGMVSDLRGKLKIDDHRLAEFETLLAAVGYDSDQYAYYTNSYILRTAPSLIPVDEACPKIIRSMIQKELGDAGAARISDVHYRVNLNGLGYAETDREFEKILGR